MTIEIGENLAHVLVTIFGFIAIAFAIWVINR